MQVDLWQLVYTLSDALDLVGVDDRYHGKRVAVMAATIGEELGWDRLALEMVFFGGLLHDSGVSSTRVHEQLISELDWSGANAHCERGEMLLASFHPLMHLAPLVRYHHTHWEDLNRKDLSEQVRLLSNLIYLSDQVLPMGMVIYGKDLLLMRKRIQGVIRRYKNTFFAPDLVEVFLDEGEEIANHKFGEAIPDSSGSNCGVARLALDNKGPDQGQHKGLDAAAHIDGTGER